MVHFFERVFCPNDKALMRPAGEGLACPKCGHVAKAKSDPGLVIHNVQPGERRLDKFDDIGLIDDPKKFKIQIWPIDDQVHCGRCGKFGAYYYLRQTRKADEPTTAFYECVTCGNKWKRAR